jgi:hypothetical protein
LGVPKCPKTAYRIYFLVVLDYFSNKNGANDLVRSLFSSLDIGKYIPPTCVLLGIFLGPFGGAQKPQNSMKKTVFCFFFNYFSYKNEPNDSVRGLFFKLRQWDIHLAPCRPLCNFASIWGCPNAPKQHRKTIFLMFWTISLNQIIRPILVGLIVQNNQKIVSYAILGHLGTPNGPK